MEMPQDHHLQAPAPLSPQSPELSPTSAAAAALANARWTPTKEQIAVLEGLYGQGLRTPTAEQIQHITARLREHGHIEGKNVFYWFQNHKARQRQKQKQQSFDYFAKLLRRPPPLPVLHHRPAAGQTFAVPLPAAPTQMPPPPTPAAAACNREVMYKSQRYMTAAPQAAVNAASFSQPQMPVQLYQRREMARDKVPAQAPVTMYHQLQQAPNSASTPVHVLNFPPATRGGGGGSADAGSGDRETLQLFPLQPTFMLPDKRRRTESASMMPAPASASSSGSLSLDFESESASAGALLFYDFFGLQNGGR